MSMFSRFEENITGAGKTALQRFLSFVFLIFTVLILDYFVGFPLGFIQLNQLEQLEKIDILLSSKTLDSSTKIQLNVEQREIVAHYIFLSDLRLSLNREFTSKINRKETIATINSTAKKSKVFIPDFLCSNYGYTISLSIIWIILFISTFFGLLNSDSIGSDLGFMLILSILTGIIFLIVRHLPKFDSCIKTHLLLMLINVIITGIVVILIDRLPDRPS
jgi:hypothetical protein